MQTFLPYKSFARTARVLDYRRLGKQRVEAMQILKALRDPSYGWQSHPAVNQWRGYINALKYYHNIIIEEWCRRGYCNNMRLEPVRGRLVYPPWLGLRKYHLSHRANLLRKDPKYYSQFNWRVDPSTPYYWPKGE